MALYPILSVVIVISFSAGRVASNPIQAQDRALTMFLTIKPDSETAEPMVGGSVTFLCDILDYQESSHVVTWSRFDLSLSSWIVLAEGGTLRAPADQRLLVSRVQANNASRPGNVHQSLVIRQVGKTDEGLYRCSVEMSIDDNSTSSCSTKAIASREMILTVYPPEIFPVCTPSAKATDPLVPGDTLSCGTLTESRVPMVTRRGNLAGHPEDWSRGQRRDKRPGWELTREVNETDDGIVYDCWSFSTEFAAVELALSCPISVTVVRGTEPPPTSGLSVGAIVGIAAGALAAVLIITVICICCCCCNS
ncbi:cell surface A33 antigen-like [Acanthaster planci]|uniref:Cell surface A33 antigen-like n=1 Tax=Acanthaster planci TaxID=133434 RepID=A0A8B7YC58_ACAPL|nr:cell surface A33 antigen-like [Acanthaster planci]